MWDIPIILHPHFVLLGQVKDSINLTPYALCASCSAYTLGGPCMRACQCMPGNERHRIRLCTVAFETQPLCSEPYLGKKFNKT